MNSINPNGINTGMDDATRGQWQAYARQLADRMGLRDYLVTISATIADDGTSGASCQCTYGRRSIRIWLSHYFFGLTPEQQRWTVVHELCHAIMRPVADLTHKNFENETKERHVLFYTLHKEAEEQAVDHFALVIAESMPLPGEAEERRRALLAAALNGAL